MFDKFEIIKLENKEEYVIIDVLEYSGKVFLLLSKVVNDGNDISDDLICVEKRVINGKEIICIISDESDEEFVRNYFNKKLDMV